jgi:hypothetical protein
MSSRAFWQQEAAAMRDFSKIIDKTPIGVNNDITIDSKNDCKGTPNRVAGHFDKNSNRWKGVTEHAAIQLDFWLTIDPLSELEYQIPESSENGNTGWADIVDSINGIYEIKTATELETGKVELERYISKGKTNCKKNFIKGFKYPKEKVIIHPTDPNKEIVAKGYIDKYQGLIIYYTRNRSENPEPIVVPKGTFEKFKELKKRVDEDIENIEKEIEEWLQKNPEVVKWIKILGYTAAILIILGTIAEDIVTLGAGIADDVQSFYLARTIVTVARSL